MFESTSGTVKRQHKTLCEHENALTTCPDNRPCKRLTDKIKNTKVINTTLQTYYFPTFQSKPKKSYALGLQRVVTFPQNIELKMRGKPLVSTLL